MSECKHETWNSVGSGLKWACGECGKFESDIVNELRQQLAAEQAKSAEWESIAATEQYKWGLECGENQKLFEKLNQAEATIAAMREALQEAHLGLKACEVYMYDGIIEQALSNTAGAEYSRVNNLEQVADDACAIMDELARGDAPSEESYEALRESLDLVGWDADNKGNAQTKRLRKLEEAAQTVVNAREKLRCNNNGPSGMEIDSAIDNLQAVLGEGKE